MPQATEDEVLTALLPLDDTLPMDLVNCPFAPFALCTQIVWCSANERWTHCVHAPCQESRKNCVGMSLIEEVEHLLHGAKGRTWCAKIPITSAEVAPPFP